MTTSCTQCGAVFSSDETCQERFTASQLMELNTPDSYTVHHLSVPCYLLQHNAYSRQGWIEVRKLLSKFVYEGWTPEMARRDARINADSGHRTWSFTRGPKLAGVERIVWSCSIANVRLDPPEAYCADVLRWARTILEDSEQLMLGLGGES
jgi:hypothetical protein